MAKRQATTRIIAGKFRGTKIPFRLNKSLRPTENKTKETLFNWLMNDLDQKLCLDMFAGTGSLGFEAISRGAVRVVFIENDRDRCRAIIDIAKKLNVQKSCNIFNANSINFDYKIFEEKFDIIFLDPPFHGKLVKKSLDIIFEQNLLAEKGLIYIESEIDLDVESLTIRMKKIGESKGGETKFYLYES
tara:strand:- start:20124 stop:20687 length:564 start_codon:yes stop_codon:yes gene_type:complete